MRCFRLGARGRLCFSTAGDLSMSHRVRPLPTSERLSARCMRAAVSSSESVERGHCALSARARLQGAGLDQLRTRIRKAIRRCARRWTRRWRTTGSWPGGRHSTECGFENGYADDPDGVAENVTKCIATGIAGLSIEDSPQHGQFPLYDFDIALTRVKAGTGAIDKAGGDVVFTARTEGFIRGRPDLDETIRRLKAFADAGADCLYSPGIKTREQIEATVKAVGGKAINFLNSGSFGFSGTISPRWACGASASAARSRASRCTPSSRPRSRSPNRARSPASTTDHQRRAE